MKYNFMVAFILLFNSFCAILSVSQNKTENYAYKNETNPNCEIRQYVLALQEFCIENQYTLHGLWGDPENACTFCTKEPFNENNLSEATLKDMNTHWMSCMNGSDNHKFWLHEWSKHGTCTGMSQEEFFSTTISLFKEYVDLCPKGSKTCQICLTPDLQLEGLCPVRGSAPFTNDV
jgi:ribonuclease I